MVAVKGIFDNGALKLMEQVPVKGKSNVLVVFLDSEIVQEKEDILDQQARGTFEKFTGSVNRIIDVKSERQEAADKKYENIS